MSKKQRNKPKPALIFTETHDYSHEELIDNENLRQWLEDKEPRTKEVVAQPIFKPTNLDFKSKISPVELGEIKEAAKSLKTVVGGVMTDDEIQLANELTARIQPVRQLKDRGPLDPKMNELQPVIDQLKFKAIMPIITFNQLTADEAVKKVNEKQSFDLMDEGEVLKREATNKKWTEQSTLTCSDDRRMVTHRGLTVRAEEAKPFSIDEIINEDVLRKIASAEDSKTLVGRRMSLPRFQRLFADSESLSPLKKIVRSEQALQEHADIVLKHIRPDLSDNLFNRHNNKMGYAFDLNQLRALHSQFITTHDILHYELNGESVNVKVPVKFNPHITFSELNGANGKIDFYRGVRGYIPYPDEFRFLQKPNVFIRGKSQVIINPASYGIKFITRPRDWGKMVENHCKKYLELHASISFYKDISIIGALNG